MDQAVYFDLVPRIEPFILTRFLQRRGQYRLAVCCAVSNFTPLYGKMDPYLKEINLQEYYYIRGPSGCQMEAMQIYSKTGLAMSYKLNFLIALDFKGILSKEN